MNVYLARFLAVLAAVVAYMVGHAVGYVRAGRDNSMTTMVEMLETRAELERRNTRGALSSLDLALESQGKTLDVSQRRSIAQMVEYGVLAFSPLDKKDDGLGDQLARRLYQQTTPPPAIVLKTAGENVPFWADFTPNPRTIGQDSHSDHETDGDNPVRLPRGVYQR